MRVGPFTISRIFFVAFVVLCCTHSAGARAFDSPPQASSASHVQAVPADGRPQIANTSSPDFTIQIAPSPLTVVYQFDGDEEEGQAVGSTSVAGTNGFAGDVNLTCSVSPPTFDEPVCFLFQTSLSVDASDPPAVAAFDVDPTSPNCVISLVKRGVVKFPDNSGWRRRMELAIALVTLVICLGAALPTRRRAEILRAGIVCGAALMMAGCGTSTLPTDPCGGGNFDTGTPPGTYMVTITGTSGNITHTATAPLIVPPVD